MLKLDTILSDPVQLGSTLPIGSSLRTVCPACGGGTSAERSLSVTRDEHGIVWQCFRAKCGYKGATSRPELGVDIAQVSKGRKQWDGKTYPLPEKVWSRVQSLWHLTDIPDGWYWTTDYGGRLCMTVYGPKGRPRGWVLRALGKARTKALTFIHDNEEGMSWYKTNPNEGTLLVEDVPSAVRASKYLNTVALLGTGIGLSRAAEIAEHAARPVIVALDQDATTLSFKWARKYALLWGDVQVLPLKQDIKNMTEEQLQELIG